MKNLDAMVVCPTCAGKSSFLKAGEPREVESCITCGDTHTISSIHNDLLNLGFAESFSPFSGYVLTKHQNMGGSPITPSSILFTLTKVNKDFSVSVEYNNINPENVTDPKDVVAFLRSII